MTDSCTKIMVFNVQLNKYKRATITVSDHFLTEQLPPIPRFTITPRNIVVNESVGEVEVCVTSDIPVSTETIVLGQTQPKDGAANQATGDCTLAV